MARRRTDFVTWLGDGLELEAHLRGWPALAFVEHQVIEADVQRQADQVGCGVAARHGAAPQSAMPAMEVGCGQRQITPMDTVPRPDGGIPATTSETEAERRERLAWEAEGIARARADVAAGRMVDSAEVDAWIDSIGTDHELPVPRTRR